MWYDLQADTYCICASVCSCMSTCMYMICTCLDAYVHGKAQFNVFVWPVHVCLCMSLFMHVDSHTHIHVRRAAAASPSLLGIALHHAHLNSLCW